MGKTIPNCIISHYILITSYIIYKWLIQKINSQTLNIYEFLLSPENNQRTII